MYFYTAGIQILWSIIIGLAYLLQPQTPGEKKFYFKFELETKKKKKNEQ